MRIEANTVEEYLGKVPEERQPYMEKLRQTILDHLPDGYQEQMQYSMPSYVVPHEIYPDGYHCDPSVPLPFVSIANQKNFIALYHMGIYAIPELQKWWEEEYKKNVKTKLDMGKSCVRFKKVEDIPYELIGELMEKVSPEEWIGIYESNIKKK